MEKDYLIREAVWVDFGYLEETVLDKVPGLEILVIFFDNF